MNMKLPKLEIKMFSGDETRKSYSGNLYLYTQNLVALQTTLGYILSLPVHTELHKNNSVATCFVKVAFNSEESIKEELHRFWLLESLGIKEKKQ